MYLNLSQNALTGRKYSSIVVSLHSKKERKTIEKLTGLDTYDGVIVDSNIDNKKLESFKNKGVKAFVFYEGLEQLPSPEGVSSFKHTEGFKPL